MPRPPRFHFFPHLAVIATVSLCGGLASDSAAGPYLNSAHGNATTGVDRASLPNTYSTGNCAHCHEQHASIGGSEPVPVKIPTGPSNYLLLDALDNVGGNAACDYCHNGSVPPPVDNIASEILKAKHHDPYSAFGPVNCDDCHDSHVAQSTNHIEATGGNAVLGTSPLNGVAGVSVTGVWPPPGNPAPGGDAGLAPGTPAVAALIPTDPITMEYQLCFKCHGGQAAYTLANLLGQFNPGNYSVHPVTTELNPFPRWNNAFLLATPAALNGVWAATPNATMYCSDCHGSNAAPPEGPHGSTIQYMLKAGGPPAPANNFDALCLRCHKDPALPGMSFWVDIWNTALVGDHNYVGHQSVVTNAAGTNALGCLACHGDSGGPLVSNIHGANYMGAVNVPATDTPLPSFTFLVSSFINKHYFTTAAGNVPGARYCEATCHAGDGAAGYAY